MSHKGSAATTDRANGGADSAARVGQMVDQSHHVVEVGSGQASATAAHLATLRSPQAGAPSGPGFAIQEKLYESSRTLVYRARRDPGGRSVILKMMKTDCPRPEEIARYRREHEITSRLSGAHVIRSLEIEIVGRRPILELEDIGGQSLKRLLPRSRWTLVELLEIAAAIAAGIAEIHAGDVIHKDINPSNIVFDPVSRRLQIIDFGISTILPRERPALKSPEVIEGTLPYISPEQTGRMNRELDSRSDLYSFGVTLYELFTRTLPFNGADALELVHLHLTGEPVPAHQLDPQIPRVVSDIIEKLLRKTAEERYQTAWGVLADLTRCLEALRGGAGSRRSCWGERTRPRRSTCRRSSTGATGRSPSSRTPSPA